MGVNRFWLVKADGGQDEKGVTTYTLVYKCEMHFSADLPPAAWTGVGINRHDPYPFDGNARAIDTHARLIEPGFYEVEYNYSSKPYDVGNSSGASGGTPADSDQSKPPQDRPWTVKFGSVKATRLLGPTDLDDVDVVNSVGEPFNPPPEIPSSNLTIDITAFVPVENFDPVAKKQTFMDSINNAGFQLPLSDTVFPQYSLRVDEYDCEIHNEHGEYFYQIHTVLEYNKRLWHPILVLDCGTMQRESASLPPQPILDKGGKAITKPIPLNGAGVPLNADDDLVYATFRAYGQSNFLLLFTT